ncbi:type II secretion system F family protein [Halobacterium rubrum]|jgi:flagellar protein FlaJ|uniref:type II secretion system F family protein n=1 Tax=Halobacterium TaxID=2239 RepID=UPI001F20005D|nr:MULTISPECIES: type II secretion system F family protein [Halobacterium]MDH5021706.1 type II secretion system F family protein [Halobacterium rubrum]
MSGDDPPHIGGDSSGSEEAPPRDDEETSEGGQPAGGDETAIDGGDGHPNRVGGQAAVAAEFRALGDSEEVAGFRPGEQTRVEWLLERALDVSDRLHSTDDQSDLDQWAYRTFSGFFRDHETWFASTERAVKQARMDESYDFYLARATMLTLIAAGMGGLLGGIFATLLHFSGLNPLYSAVAVPASVESVTSLLRVPLAGFLVVAVTALTFAVPTGTLLLYLPRIRADKRGRQIDMLLPQAVTYIYALSQGSLTIPAIVRKLAGDEEAYGEIAVEFQSVVNNMDYLGADLREALHRTRDATPSDELAELFSDLSSIVESGGGATSYLAQKTESYQRRARRQKDSHIERIDTVGQFYIVAGVIFPLLVMSTFLVLSAITQQGLYRVYIIIYLGLPFISALFIVFLDTTGTDDQTTSPTLTTGSGGVTPSEIEKRLEGHANDEGRGSRGTSTDGGYHRPVRSRTDGHSGSLSPVERSGLIELYSALRKRHLLSVLREPVDAVREYPPYSLLVTVPVAGLWLLAMSVLGISTPTPAAFLTSPVYTTTLSALIPLFVALTPLSYYHERQARRQRKVNKQLPNVLDKLASASDRGDSVTENLRTVAESSDTYLTRELEATYNELAGWSVSFEDAMTRLANRVKNPRLSRVVNLLLEANTASGRVNDVLEVAASDVKTAFAVEEERRKKTRTHIVIAIFGNSVFLLISIVLVVVMLPALSNAAEATPNAVQAGAGAASALPFQQGVSPIEFKLLFYHGALFQALFSGLVAGKIGYDNVLSGLKISLPQLLLVEGVFLLL